MQTVATLRSFEHDRQKKQVETVQGSWLTGLLLRKHTQKIKVRPPQCVTGTFPKQRISFLWKSWRNHEKNIPKQMNKMDINNSQNWITTMSEIRWYLQRISEGTQIEDYQILAEICNMLINLPKEQKAVSVTIHFPCLLAVFRHLILGYGALQFHL